MAISDSDYEGSFTIPTPKGIYQAAGDTNISADYAYSAVNMRTERGLLATGYGVSRAFPSLGQPIGTLTRFYRRNRPDDPEIFVAAAGGAIYTYTLGTEGWVMQAEGFLSDTWSSVTYEAAENGETVDILIMSNADDGMVAVYGSDLRVEKKALTIGDDMSEVRFSELGRYAERIWGTGDRKHPDSIFYSRPYNPFDWTGSVDTPQTAGGMIQTPTWDGESFIAIKPFCGYLLAIKPTTVFEIRGTDPSSFTITEAYGTDGPISARTIEVDRTNMFYLANGGIGRYDGSSLSLLARDALYEAMRMRAAEIEHLATSCVCDHVYYLALGIHEREGDVLVENNAVIEFDSERGTFMLRKGMRVKDFFSLGGKVYYTMADAPYDVMRYNDPSANGLLGQPMEALWETPWLDLGKAFVKRDFVLRFTAEADEDDVPLEISVVTERREKLRVVPLYRNRRDYRVKIGNAGKRVKLRIRSSRRAAGWRIYGGVQVNYSIDGE